MSIRNHVTYPQLQIWFFVELSHYIGEIQVKKLGKKSYFYRSCPHWNGLDDLRIFIGVSYTFVIQDDFFHLAGYHLLDFSKHTDTTITSRIYQSLPSLTSVENMYLRSEMLWFIWMEDTIKIWYVISLAPVTIFKVTLNDLQLLWNEIAEQWHQFLVCTWVIILSIITHYDCWSENTFDNQCKIMVYWSLYMQKIFSIYVTDFKYYGYWYNYILKNQDLEGIVSVLMKQHTTNWGMVDIRC